MKLKITLGTTPQHFVDVNIYGEDAANVSKFGNFIDNLFVNKLEVLVSNE